METLPPQILRALVQGLPLPDVVAFAATCKTCYDVVADMDGFRVMVTPTTVARGQRAWIERRAAAIQTLRVSRAWRAPMTDAYPWLNRLRAMRSCTAAFCRITPSIFHALPRSRTLLNLDLHQLVPYPDKDNADVFSTRILAKFAALRRCCITFGPGWSLVMAGPGLEDLRDLAVLVLRRAPAIAVTRSIQATDVHLHATDVLSCRVPVAPRAISLRLECDDHPVMLRDMDLPTATLSYLEISSRGMVSIPKVAHMTRLHTLIVTSHTFVVPNMHALTSLKRLCVDVSYCLVVDRRSAMPPAADYVRTLSRNVPIDLKDFIETTAPHQIMPPIPTDDNDNNDDNDDNDDNEWP